MLKKVFSVVLCVVLTCTMLSAFAITANDISSVTEYTGDVEGEVSVVTTVANTVGGTTYTYLAHNGELATLATNPANIVYVDEKVADGITTTFDFVSSSVNFASTAVLVSGEAGGTVPAPAPEDNYSVSVDGATAVTGKVELAGDYVFIPADFGAKKVEAVTVNNVAAKFFAAANGVQVETDAFTATEGLNEVVITTGEAKNAYIKTEGLGITEGAIIAMAHVLGAVDEFGIQFSDAADFKGSVVWTAKALGKGTNDRYAVKVNGYVGDEAFAADATVYARAYYVVDGAYTYGKTWEVNPTVAGN